MKNFTLVLLCIFSLSITVAQNTISGTVSDFENPLAFATVFIKGTTTGTLTDESGRFTIKTSKGDTLTISYVGYTTQNVSIDNGKKLEIHLENNSLDEVVIVGYSTAKIRTIITCRSTCSIRCKTAGVCIDEQKTNQRSDINPLVVFPNPSSNGYFNLNLSASYETIDISVSSITGQIVHSQSYISTSNQISIDLSRYPTGIYIINTMADGKRLPTQKVIRG